VHKRREGHGGSHRVLQWMVGQWSSPDYDEQRWRSVVLNDAVHNAMRREMRRREDVEA
jgi:hypothetical protein